jgi:hypothetical protein
MQYLETSQGCCYCYCFHQVLLVQDLHQQRPTATISSVSRRSVSQQENTFNNTPFSLVSVPVDDRIAYLQAPSNS